MCLRTAIHGRRVESDRANKLAKEGARKFTFWVRRIARRRFGANHHFRNNGAVVLMAYRRLREDDVSAALTRRGTLTLTG